MDLIPFLINRYSNRVLGVRVKKNITDAFYAEQLKSANELVVPELKGTIPVIVLGMHRSGTTMTSRLLRQSGLHMGALRGSDTDESVFFENVNKAILSLANARWDNPVPLEKALTDEAFYKPLVNVLAAYCSTRIKTRNYFGYSVVSPPSFFNMSGDWGWKDPRTCYTLPVWRALFPHAKILFIYRNGIDVAQSLVVRNKRINGENAGLYKTAELPAAFELWEIYNKKCLEEIESYDPERVLSVQYENLLNNPEKILGQVLGFLGLKNSPDHLSHLSGQVQRGRGNAFLRNEELDAFYEKVKDREIMTTLGYSDLRA